MSAERGLDVVVYGATGFVGRLTAEYLARSAPPEVRIGLGGRSQSKLEQVRSSLGARAADWPLVVADSSDAGAIEQLANATRVGETTVVVTALKGGPSGGTIDSVRGQIAEMRGNPARARIAADPYGLSPDRSAEPQLGDESDVRMPEYSPELRRWLGPFVMAAINTRQVRRSNALQSWAYGRRFKYREVMGFAGGLAGRAQATAVALGTGALFAGLSFAPTRSVLDRVLPKPGEGPSEEARRKGFYKIEIHARTPSGERWVCREVAQGDPGYAATAVMLGESALALALDRDRLPDAAGVLTPATAIGSVLADRLRAAGQTWEVERLGAGAATTTP